MKTKARYIILFLSLLSICLSVAGVGVQQMHAQDEPEIPVTAEPVSEDPQSCGECHIDITLNWEASAHALTYHTEAFQTAISNGADDTCYACHATGYTPFNGEFTHEGVACEACHGQTPSDHPDVPVAVHPGLEVCADCHTTTFQEWEVSAHGNEGIPCTGCHDPHAQALRFETAQALCVNCHQEAQTDYVHVSHETEMCSSCHWHRGTFDTDSHLLTGALGVSGHEGHVETLACIDCHEGLEENVAITVEDTIAGSELQLIAQELETEIANVRAQGENAAAVRLVQGIVVGLAGGAIIAFVFVRLSPGRHIRIEE